MRVWTCIVEKGATSPRGVELLHVAANQPITQKPRHNMMPCKCHAATLWLRHILGYLANIGPKGAKTPHLHIAMCEICHSKSHGHRTRTIAFSLPASKPTSFDLASITQIYFLPASKNQAPKLKRKDPIQACCKRHQYVQRRAWHSIPNIEVAFVHLSTDLER